IWALKCSSCTNRGRLDGPAVGIPPCPECGSHLRPDVVWFGESLDRNVMAKVYSELEQADVCMIIGTSVFVQPAASFPLVVKQLGGQLVEVNVERTPLTPAVDVHLSGMAGVMLPEVDSLL
ncbi:MAG: NAD-dependent protein deacylase, partial [Candidatus Thorarchaeota archaeon]